MNVPERNLRLLLELGRGGMGVVYLALQQGPAGFAKLKVVKRLRPDVASEPSAVSMFLEEGRLSARLHHPNVVATNEAGFDGKHYFLEMEYLEGQSFEALVSRAQRSGGLAIPLGAWILAQALAGLHYAHELADHDGTPLKVVHRDVSPHNVFVTYDGQVKVLDFGIAKAADSRHETQTGVVKGKVTYMAPEQVARKALDRRVDVFAAGVILWQLLAGERLWKDIDGFEIFLKLRSEPIPPPSSVRPVDPDLEAIATKALARDPEERFASAEAMQRALEGWLDAKGHRVGARDVASAMQQLFAEDRAIAKGAVDEAIRQTPPEESAALVPMLRRPAAIVTGTNAATASTVGDGTRVRQVRGMRALAFASVGIAMAASVAAGVAIWKGRQRAAIAPAGSAASDAAAGCAKNADCHAGQICRKDHGRCVTLGTDRCEVLAEKGDAENDRTIWIGAMLPRTGPHAAIGGIPALNAVDLARRDFAKTTRGVPARSVDEAPRPLAVIACDDAADEAASARHLIDLGAPAVIGFNTSDEAIELARDLFVPSRVLAATIDFSALVTQVQQPPGPRLVWRTTQGSAANALPIARVVSELLEPRVRRSPSPAGRMRVAFVRPANQLALAMAEALTANLTFNGRSALANGDDFAQVTFADPSEADAHPDYGAVVAQLLASLPDVVIYSGEDELVDTVFAPVERGWPAGRRRPYWISATNLEGEPLFAFIGGDADRRRRFFGVSTPAATVANSQLAMHYDAEFSPKVTVNDTPAAAYDAVYLLGYAAYVVGDAPVTGPALASAFARLVKGKSVDVGPTHIFEAIDLLRRGDGFHLVGAQTQLAFDLATGEPTVDYVVQCVGVGAGGRATDAIDSGVTLDAATGKLRGELRCP